MVGAGHDTFAPRSDVPSERPARRPWRWPGALKTWLVERRLDTIGAAAAAALTAGLLFALGGLVRLPCDSTGCPAYAGVPASLLETVGIVALLAGLAATGVWIAGTTQRTWVERLRLRRVEMELQVEQDADRLRRIDAILDDRSQVSAIQAQSRLYLWSGLPVGVASLMILPFAIATFAEPEEQAAYMLPVVLLAAVAGGAAVVRGLSLATGARRLTKPLQPERARPKGGRRRPAKAQP